MESLVESIYAPLAGVVADVRVNEGTKVASGEMILTIKGEGFEKVITHYKGGIISQICVSNGTRVKQGDLIATITSADNQSSTAEKTSPTNSNNSTGYVSSFEKQKKNSTVAALLATFLGQFGAHDFYAGRTLCGVAKIVMYFASLFLVSSYSTAIILFALIISLANMIWVIYDMIQIARNNFSSNKYIVSTEGNKTTWIYVVVSIQILFFIISFFTGLL